MSTYRSEEETLRERVRVLEEALAGAAPPRPPAFDLKRPFRRLTWWFLANSPLVEDPHSNGWLFSFMILLAFITCAGGVASFMFRSPVWLLASAGALTPIFVRLWLRTSMKLDDKAARAAWEEWFE